MISAAHYKPFKTFPPQARQSGRIRTGISRHHRRLLILVLGLAILTGLAVKGAESAPPEQGFSEPLGWHSFDDTPPC